MLLCFSDRQGIERLKNMPYFVYILANQTNVTLYTGVTNNLERRIWEHKSEIDSGSFTAKYHVHKLVYYETTTDAETAILREKQIKSWSRKKKNQLVETINPFWKDLYFQDTSKEEL